MKIKIFLATTLLMVLLLVGCNQKEEPVIKDVVISASVNIETGSIISITTPHQAVIRVTQEYYQLVVTINRTLTENERLVFNVNGSVISEVNYQLEGSVITYNIPRINDPIVSVDVSFDLAGGQWNKDIYETIDSDYNMTSNSKNSLSSMDLTVFNRRNSGLADYDKIFLEFNDVTRMYEIVAWDNHTGSIQVLNVPYHDYIIAIHKDSTDKNNFDIMQLLMADSAIGLVLLFDESISSFKTGEMISMSIYNPQTVYTNYMLTLNSPKALPIPSREGFTFLGWWSGNELISSFTPYKASDDIDSIQYQARWFGATITELYSIIDELVPETMTASLVLPEIYKNFTLVWSSSDPSVLLSDGTYIKPYTTMDLEVTATIENELGEVYTKTYITHIDGKKSLDGTVASSYIYRNYHLVGDDTFETLDIINTAFIHADASGQLSGTTFLNNISSYIIPRATEYGTWVIVSVAPDSEWAEFSSTDEKLNFFADNIVKLINDYGFDGVDIDWEFPRTNAEELQYVKLMRIVYEKVKANNPNHLVTTAIAGGTWQPQHYRLHESSQYMDYVNMMTYGLVYNSTSYQNPLYPRVGYHDTNANVGRTLSTTSIDESIAIFNGLGIPNSKIIVGLAFYGVTQTLSDGVWTNSGSITYTDIKNNLLENDDYIKRYDEVSQVPYIISRDGTYFISYDNPKSIRAKVDYVLEHDLKGVMFWEWGTDTTGILLQAIKSSLN